MQKKTILNIETVYTANEFAACGKTFVAGGSETTPAVYLHDLAAGTSELVADCPGGVMSFVPVPGIKDQYYSVQGLFPGFIGFEAGIYRHAKIDGAWKTEKVIDLPFAHRCDVIEKDGVCYLFAASCSKYKADPADWSKQGEVLVARVDENGLAEEPKVIFTLGRNHGMLKAKVNGEDMIFVSGEQGIFYFDMNDGCKPVQIFDKEVSEFGLLDMDGDGVEELVAIEPFHGHMLNLYKRNGNAWELKFTDELSFGHGLSCGIFNGEPIFVVGNRRGPLTLVKYSPKNVAEGIVEKEILEEECGPTQTQVFNFDGTDYILSANQLKKEVTLYSK